MAVCGATTSKVPQHGLIAWYKSSALGQTGNGGTKWASSVGSFVGKPLAGTVETVTTTGNGAKCSVRMVTGATTTSYTFGDILTDHYTICSMTRYTGSHKWRILNGAKTNWIHGHWNGKAGVAHYDGWLGQSTTRLKNVDDWVVLCGTRSISDPIYPHLTAYTLIQPQIPSSNRIYPHPTPYTLIRPHIPSSNHIYPHLTPYTLI